MKITVYFSIIIFFFQSGCVSKGNVTEKKAENSVINIDFDRLIDLNRDEGQRGRLLALKESFMKKDEYLSVSEHEDYYEIIISHKSYKSPSKKNFSGGAEQFLLNKKTGELRMGWHEHPMALPD